MNTNDSNQNVNEFMLVSVFEIEELETRVEFAHWDKNHEPSPGEEGWVEYIQ